MDKGISPEQRRKNRRLANADPRRICSAKFCGTPCIAAPRKVSSSNSHKTPRLAPQWVCALSNMVSTTGEQVELALLNAVFHLAVRAIDLS